jgi:uncharacterized membrane protein (UPF0182 family)
MKKIIYGFAIACLVTVLACNTKPAEPAQNQSQLENVVEDITETMYAVPLDTAMKNVHRYDSISQKYLKEIPVKSFTIRSVDLLEAMGMPVTDTKFKHVRVYLGLNDGNDFKIYLTPVVHADLSANPPRAGKDHILSGKYHGLGGSGPYMLDFAQPCPNTCPN